MQLGALIFVVQHAAWGGFLRFVEELPVIAMSGGRQYRKINNVARVLWLAACALGVTACASNPSYQAEAIQASQGGDQKRAVSLAEKEVARFSTPDQCSGSSNVNCGTLALAYGGLAEYQILSGNKLAGERSFILAKDAIRRTPLDHKRSATGMVYRDVSEAYWKTGDKTRAIAVFNEGRAAGGDSWLFTASAAEAAKRELMDAPSLPEPDSF